ncbi:MAG: exo-alpha-sialidase, partial [Pirellulales bacterium]
MILLLSSRLATALQIGETVGPVTFETIDGYTRTMDNYGDRPGTVVVFLSARSDATLHQLPAIQAVHRKYRTDDVLFVGVCSAAEEKGDELRTFAQRTGLIFPVHRDLSGQVAKRFGATATPEFFLIDRRGVLVYRGGLGDREEGLEEAIVELLVDTPVRHTVSSLRGDPIGPNGKRREIPDPYGSMAFSSELVFTTIDGVPAHHCSTIAEAPSGDLLCLWYAGSYESADDQALYLARLPKGTRKWTRPQRLIWDPQQPPGNAVIFRQPDGRVAIVWGRMEGSRPTRRGSGWETCRLMIRTSDDDGQRWSTERELPNTFGYLPRNIPITLSDGRIALPIT